MDYSVSRRDFLALTLASLAARRLDADQEKTPPMAAPTKATETTAIEHPVTYGAVITGVSPLETDLLGVHPRLHLTAERISQFKQQIHQEPWQRLFERVRQTADTAAQHSNVQGGTAPGLVEPLPSLGLAWLVQGQAVHLETAHRSLTQILRDPEWKRDAREGGSYLLGRVLYSVALAYDWLYHGLEPGLRDGVRDLLHHAGRQQMEVIALQEHFFASALAHNHCSSIMADITAAGLAVYGDVPDVGPWLKVIIERARAMTAPLGPDGVSAEGICYGGYYTDRLIRSLDLVKSLLGVDLFESTPWLRNVPLFYAYSMLPRKHWTPSSCHFCFGDGVRYPWFGPAYFMRRLATAYRDPLAQWLAEETDRAGVSADADSYLHFLWHDPDIPAVGPQRLPSSHHFEDKGLIIMRSGWDGNEAVCGFKCGPHSGHHALQHYPSDIGGGHMQPDAGSFLLFAHGDWLVSDGGYSYKHTIYRNTLLINGKGQTGEGGEWFENIELRRERRGPRVLHFAPGEDFDQISADLAPAYDATARLQRLRRHVLYLKPSCWVIVDDIKTEVPATFESFFHADAGQPFTPQRERVWETHGKQGALTLSALLPTDMQGTLEQQRIQSMGAHDNRTLEVLRLAPTAKRDSALFITVLEPHPAAQSLLSRPSLEMRKGETNITLWSGTVRHRFRLRRDGDAIASPAFEPLHHSRKRKTSA
jgi:hypothetical protein